MSDFRSSLAFIGLSTYESRLSTITQTKKKNKQTDNKMRIQEYPDTFGQGLRLQCL